MSCPAGSAGSHCPSVTPRRIKTGYWAGDVAGGRGDRPAVRRAVQPGGRVCLEGDGPGCCLGSGSACVPGRPPYQALLEVTGRAGRPAPRSLQVALVTILTAVRRVRSAARAVRERILSQVWFWRHETPDRDVLEQVIFPALCERADVRRILLVG